MGKRRSRSKSRKSQPKKVSETVQQKIETGTPPKESSYGKLWMWARSVSLFVIGTVLSIYAGIIVGAWGIPWPTHLEIEPYANGGIVAANIPFDVRNRSAWPAKKIAIKCSIEYFIYESGNEIGRSPINYTIGQIAGNSKTHGYCPVNAAVTFPGRALLRACISFEITHESWWPWLVDAPTPSFEWRPDLGVGNWLKVDACRKYSEMKS